jgi:aspartate carbamoyltransferase catalytic subunit
MKKLPTLRGPNGRQPLLRVLDAHVVVFELAAKRLSADVMSVKSSGSSVDKGESLKDTALTLDAYDPDVIVIRHPHIGAPNLVARVTGAHVVNAGDGKHQHPTQALLDLYTIEEHVGPSRAARRDRRRRAAFARRPLEHPGADADGRAVTLVGPPPLIPRGIEAMGCEVSTDIGAIAARRRRLRPAHAARADGVRRELRAVACASTRRAGA